MRGKGLFGMRVKLARTGVTFDDGVELPCVEGLKPRAKPRQLARRKLFDGLFNIFGSGHDRDVALARGVEKGCPQDVSRTSPTVRPWRGPMTGSGVTRCFIFGAWRITRS